MSDRRAAVLIAYGADLGVAPSFGATDGLNGSPPFPPPAQRRALTSVLSTEISSGVPAKLAVNSANGYSPDAFSEPAMITIVNRRVRTVFGGAIPPPATGSKNRTDPRDDPPIIFAPPTRPTVSRMWCDRRPLGVGKPALPRHAPERHLLRSRLFKHLKINE